MLIQGIKKVYTLDMTSATPSWEPFVPFTHARKEHYLVALPGGTILAIGGDDLPGTGAVLIPELHNNPNDPAESWQDMAPMDTTVDRCGISQNPCATNADCKNCSSQSCSIVEDCPLGDLCLFGRCISQNQPTPQCVVDANCPGSSICISFDSCFDIPRAHHASALLLPDARVLMAGGDLYETTHATENLDAQIFSPPYLYTSGGVLANRPVIDLVDGTASCFFPADKIISYGNDFTVNFSQATGISAVNLIALGAATHSFDQSQRFIDLPFTTPTAGVLTVTAPPTPEAAPPGYYMLFIIDNNGVPSVAEIIQLTAACPSSQAGAGPMTAPAPAPGEVSKNRYLSFAPNNGTDVVAFQLELTDCPQFTGSVGKTWWVSAPSQVNFAGADYNISTLSKTPVFRSWDAEDVVHIGDCRVVPVATYELRATSDEVQFTTPLELKTILQPAAPRWWGDVVGQFNGTDWEPPQGFTNFDDVNAAIKGFQEDEFAAPMTWLDVEPEEPNYLVNFNDVLRLVLAWQGEQYNFVEPACCLDCPAGAPVVGNNMTFTLVPSNPFIDAGEGVDIEVFVDSIPDLGGYQVTLEVIGGTSGELVLTEVTVDTEHPDYVFEGLSGIPTPDLPRGRVGNALTGTPSGVSVSGSGYLATFSYIPSESATGDFHVEVVVGHDDTSPMDSTATRLAYNGGSCTVIGVGFDCHVDADCDDLNDCTIDACVSDACTFTNAASGTACDDGLFCTTTSECDGAGTCVGSGSPCPSKTPVCCELTDTCVAVGVSCPAPT